MSNETISYYVVGYFRLEDDSDSGTSIREKRKITVTTSSNKIFARGHSRVIEEQARKEFISQNAKEANLDI